MVRVRLARVLRRTDDFIVKRGGMVHSIFSFLICFLLPKQSKSRKIECSHMSFSVFSRCSNAFTHYLLILRFSVGLSGTSFCNTFSPSVWMGLTRRSFHPCFVSSTMTRWGTLADLERPSEISAVFAGFQRFLF